MEQELYEQIINNMTMKQLSDLDSTEPLDAEETRKLLSTYITAVTRRDLIM